MSEELTPAEIVAELTVPDTTEDFELELPSGRKIILKIRPLTWTDMSDAAAKAFALKQSEDGQAVLEFNPSIYRIEILKRRIAHSPVPITAAIIRRLRPEIGQRLESLVPDPFSSMAAAKDVPKD